MDAGTVAAVPDAGRAGRVAAQAARGGAEDARGEPTAHDRCVRSAARIGRGLNRVLTVSCGCSKQMSGWRARWRRRRRATRSSRRRTTRARKSATTRCVDAAGTAGMKSWLLTWAMRMAGVRAHLLRQGRVGAARAAGGQGQGQRGQGTSVGRVGSSHLIRQLTSNVNCQLVLYLNRAMCKIKLAKIEDALWDCDQVGRRVHRAASCRAGIQYSTD